ncbi:adenosine deaminase [Alteromonas sp. McT4-15]|uniref:adenosine deaminase n=1 Tax=Alteromonas sp. McT4-15 TaxID=2881256 RepID=UPI0012E5E207|nr:adenosine deaminase [Alteromonas sp. McT4-15]MCB4436422.1 adenosine deaminase [Alteromonas sp. McT4-15]MEC8231748.1 adenosine deaminase [Pseudomonadota bacterium]GFD89133.1 adenine deaminase [Tenacibaculum sp. KUL152]
MSLSSIIKNTPKAELHLHIEGSLTPKLMWRLAEKHSITLPYASVEEIEAAYNFKDLQSFLDIYYAGAGVLIDEDDFFDLMWEYLTRCHEENIVHTEIMFDPQTHTEREIGFDVFMPGFLRAMQKAQDEYGISSFLIMSFLRHLPESSAFETLEAAKPYYRKIKAVGLDSSELGHPPSKFERVFKKAKDLGFKIVAHAGEEGPADYIWEAIKLLDVDRIDHGVRCQEDESLMAYLKEKQIPLTVCPLSNLKLCVIDDMKQHNILALLDAGLLVTVNSDDPTYFGGFLNANFEALANSLDVNQETIKSLAINSFKASFLSDGDKAKYIQQVKNV